MTDDLPLSLYELRRIALRASADPRTVRREITAPGSVRGITGDRIRAALRALGIVVDRVACAESSR